MSPELEVLRPNVLKARLDVFLWLASELADRLHDRLNILRVCFLVTRGEHVNDVANVLLNCEAIFVRGFSHLLDQVFKLSLCQVFLEL